MKISALVLLISLAGAADAFAEPQGASKVDPQNGAFRTEVPFTLPAYHGLEPQLGLAYDSSVRNGFVGVGWRLLGASRIVARRPRGGVPAFDDSDEYTLDGSPLRPCSGARCSGSGGTHVREQHRFERIVRDPVADKWFVTAGDGTVREYWRTVWSTGGTFSWELRRVRDRDGNTVDYGYVVEDRTAYLDTIRYADVIVTLIREDRPDRVGFQAGGAVYGEMTKRLQQIRVTVGGALRNAWVLDYLFAAAGSFNSLLFSIDRCGADVTVTPVMLGHYTTGTCLPRTSFTYGRVDDGYGLTLRPIDSTQAFDYRNYKPAVGDFDGDGRADLVWTELSATGFRARVMRWNGVDRFTEPTATTTLAGDFSGWAAGAADLDGDGRSELVLNRLGPAGWQVRTFRWEGSALVAGTSYLPMPTCAGCPTDYTGYVVAFVDENRDGAVDLVATRTSATAFTRIRARSVRGPSWSVRPPELYWNVAGNYANWGALIGDFRNHGVAAGAFSYPPTPPRAVLAADLNGDGADDVVEVALSAHSSGVHVGDVTYRSFTGSDAAGVGMWQSFTSDLPSFSFGRGGVSAADFNGDGYADLFGFDIDGRRLAIWPSTVAGLQRWTTVAFGSTTMLASAPLIGDFNGDGRSDILTHAAGAASIALRVALSDGVRPGVLVGVTTPSGGRTSVSYASSSDFENSYLPVGFNLPVVRSLTVDDGRGTASTRTYDYEGGLWSDDEGAFLGFATTTQTAGDGTRTETSYEQTRASAGAISLITVTDAQHRIFSQTQRTYLESESWPFYSLLASEVVRTCNQHTVCKEAQTETTWDLTYGVPTRVDRHGDLAIDGDESTTLTTYTANSTAFIGIHPAIVRTFAGIGTAGTQLAMKTIAYDGASSPSIPPTRGHPTTIERWLDRPTPAIVRRTMGYAADGNLIASTDELGRTTTYAYDATGRFRTATCNALGQCTTTTWDPVLGVAIASTDANARTTSTTYDLLGRPRRITYPNGGSVEHRYVATGDAAAQYVEVSQSDGSADGLWVRTFTDGLDRVYQIENKSGARQLTEWSAVRPTQVARRSNWHFAGASPVYTSFTYDGLGRTTRTTAPDGSTTTVSHGASLTVTTDPRGGSRAETFDGLGRQRSLREWIDGAWRRTSLTYDPLGRVIAVIDAKGNQTTQTYDSLDRLVDQCDPDRGCRSYGYDAVGNRVTQTDAKGQVVTSTYDALDRLRTRTGGYAWFYDQPGHGLAKGRLTRHTFPGGRDDFSYDFAGRVIERSMVRDGVTEIVGSTYDTTGLGRLVSTVYADETITRAYDDAGRVRSVVGLVPYASAIGYDADEQITSITLGNGVVETYTFDPASARLASQRVAKGSSTLLHGVYGYDAAGAVTSLRTTIQGVTRTLAMTYDPLGRLVTVSGDQQQTFAYDVLGNMTHNSALGAYRYDDPAHVHAVTQAGSRAYVYDANGNLILGGGRELTWDIHDRLSQVSTTDGTSTYAYDGHGARARQTSGGVTTTYFGAFADRAGATTTRYIFLGERRLARRQVETGKTVYFHPDALGSTRVLTTANGGVARTFDYAPFGAPRATTGTGADTDVRFGGYRSDTTGLHYLQARYYDPELGRFLSADAIVPRGTPQQLNRYSYADNSPFTYRDPSGRFSIGGLIGGIGRALSGAGTAVGNAISAVGGAINGAVRSYTGANGATNVSPTTGNHPGNPNAPGYYGRPGGTDDRSDGSRVSSPANHPGSPTAPGYSPRLEPTQAGCGRMDCDRRNEPFPSVTGRILDNPRYADSLEDVDELHQGLHWAGPLYGETEDTHEVYRWDYDQVFDPSTGGTTWDSRRTQVSPDEVPSDYDIIVIDRDEYLGF